MVQLNHSLFGPNPPLMNIYTKLILFHYEWCTKCICVYTRNQPPNSYQNLTEKRATNQMIFARIKIEDEFIMQLKNLNLVVDYGSNWFLFSDEVRNVVNMSKTCDNNIDEEIRRILGRDFRNIEFWFAIVEIRWFRRNDQLQINNMCFTVFFQSIERRVAIAATWINEKTSNFIYLFNINCVIFFICLR